MSRASIISQARTIALSLAVATLAAMMTPASDANPLLANPLRATPLVIAHRGASAYLPEHSLLAVVAAHAMGADFIEQDVVLSRDGVPVVLHDIHLERTTDVASRFPDRARADGRYYAIDFDLAELHTLSLTERRATTGENVYPGRFPQLDLPLRIPTLEDEILLIKGLNASTGREAGWYIELKAPSFHAAAGADIAAAVVAVLERHDLNSADAPVYLQCFEPATLKQLRTDLNTPLPLIQLIGDNRWGDVPGVDFDQMRSPAGLAEVAVYADGIGPWIPQLFDNDGSVAVLATEARRLGLAVHPYTLRADDLALELADFDALQRAVFIEAGATGAFTDFPDLTRAFVDSLGEVSR